MNNKGDTLRAEFIEYVSKLTRHIRIDYLRRLKYRREFEISKEDLYDSEQDEEPSIDDTLMVDEAVQLNWVLSDLTYEEQRIVRLCVIEEKPALEVATVLGKSERWIRTVKKRALFKLKNSISEGEQSEPRTRFLALHGKLGHEASGQAILHWKRGSNAAYVSFLPSPPFLCMASPWTCELWINSIA